MATRFVNIDRDTPMLLPPDLREWAPADDMVHFVIEAVSGMNLSELKINRRGSGSEQYPPKMMLSLLIYFYANGIFSSRRIERATYRDVAVRFLTADTHPDHDTICTFRRENFEAVAEAFLQVLQLARTMGVLKVGTVASTARTSRPTRPRTGTFAMIEPSSWNANSKRTSRSLWSGLRRLTTVTMTMANRFLKKSRVAKT
jgi:transposase